MGVTQPYITIKQDHQTGRKKERKKTNGRGGGGESGERGGGGSGWQCGVFFFEKKESVEKEGVEKEEKRYGAPSNSVSCQAPWYLI